MSELWRCIECGGVFDDEECPDHFCPECGEMLIPIRAKEEKTP